MASKFAGYKPNGLERVECNVVVHCKLKTKPKTVAKVKEALQIIWSKGPIDKAVRDLSN